MTDLIIAEKPSVARDLVSALGRAPIEKKEEYFKTDNLIITWSVGHLLALSYPQKYKQWTKSWKKEQLPIIPDEFLINPVGDKRARAQLAVLKTLLNSKEVDTVINACDAGREGELIFAYIYQYSGSVKPVERVWLQSMTEKSIKEAFKKRKPGSDFSGLESAARSRSEADWLFGINGTQAATLALSPLKMDVLSLGRVQTPTLAILQKREKEIQGFKPEPYSVIEGVFKTKSGESYKGKIDARFEKSKAEAIAASLDRVGGVIQNLKKTEKKVPPPLLFDLTSLQREAGSKYGLTAKKTLSLAQRLYEHHKVISYPRTSSRFLPEDLDQDVVSIMKAATSATRNVPARKVVAASFPRVFDGSKVTDHFAIIPTDKTPSGLSDQEEKIYDMIVRRFFSVFEDPAILSLTRFETKVKDEVFKTSGKIYKEKGWRAIEPVSDEEPLPMVSSGDVVDSVKIKSINLETKPPKRYSDASLLSAMETAGRELDDEEMRELMKDSGLGTPATRAAIIERLIDVGYLERIKGRSLKVSEKGVLLIDLLNTVNAKIITSPELTGSWEKELLEIEKDGASRDKFLKEIKKETEKLVQSLFEIKLDDELIKKTAAPDELGPCPFCRAAVRENRRAFSCWAKDNPGCGFSIWKKVAGKSLPRETILELFQNQKTAEPVEGFRSKNGRVFSAKLKLELRDKKTVISFDEDWAKNQES